jgi:hypothetical protein
VAEPGRDEGDGHALEMHECGAGMPRIVQPDLGHLEIQLRRPQQLWQLIPPLQDHPLVVSFLVHEPVNNDYMTSLCQHLNIGVYPGLGGIFIRVSPKGQTMPSSILATNPFSKHTDGAATSESRSAPAAASSMGDPRRSKLETRCRVSSTGHPQNARTLPRLTDGPPRHQGRSVMADKEHRNPQSPTKRPRRSSRSKTCTSA